MCDFYSNDKGQETSGYNFESYQTKKRLPVYFQTEFSAFLAQMVSIPNLFLKTKIDVITTDAHNAMTMNESQLEAERCIRRKGRENVPVRGCH